MNKWTPRRPPALAVATVVLVAAVGGTAIAGPDAITSALTKSKVKKIAGKQVKKLAPGLSVAHADSAEPSLFARVLANGDVDAARSKGITSANVDAGDNPGEYCFYGLPSGIKGAQVTNDYLTAVNVPVAFFGIGAAPSACPGDEDAIVTVETPSVPPVNSGFYIVLYR
jgi:hypothetical protein